MNPNDPISSPRYVPSTPDWVKPHIDRASQQYNIPPIILSALLKQESGFNPRAGSPVGAQGIAQFMPATARGMGVDPWDPESAIMGAARYLRNSYDKFGRMDLALAAYNAGGGAVSQYGNKIPPYKETQNYVKNIMAMAGEPHASYNQPSLDRVGEAKKQAEKIGQTVSQIPQGIQQLSQRITSGNGIRPVQRQEPEPQQETQYIPQFPIQDIPRMPSQPQQISRLPSFGLNPQLRRTT